MLCLMFALVSIMNFAGIPITPKLSTTGFLFETGSFSSIKTIKSNPLLVISCWIISLGSSLCSQVLMKRNSTSGSSLYLFTAICMAGNDFIQGAHQVAQKSRTTTLPSKSFKDTVFPSRSSSVKSGAGSGLVSWATISWLIEMVNSTNNANNICFLIIYVSITIKSKNTDLILGFLYKFRLQCHRAEAIYFTIDIVVTVRKPYIPHLGASLDGLR